MRNRLLIPVLLFAAPLLASAPQAPKGAAIDTAPPVSLPAKGMHRYMVTRTFPAGALAGLDAAGKKAVNKCNSQHGVRWVYSYANADRTKTFCIYEAANEQAIRDAAAANKIPVDDIVEIPVVLRPR